MQFQTKIIKYRGKNIVKIPNAITKSLGIKIGDTYDISAQKGAIFIKFH